MIEWYYLIKLRSYVATEFMIAGSDLQEMCVLNTSSEIKMHTTIINGVKVTLF